MIDDRLVASFDDSASNAPCTQKGRVSAGPDYLPPTRLQVLSALRSQQEERK